MKDHLSPENIYEILLGICSEEEHAAFSRHLGTCELCGRTLEESQEILKHLDTMHVPECSEKRWNDLLKNAVRQALSLDLAMEKPKKPRFPLTVKWVWGFALLILVFVCGYLAGVSHGDLRISGKERSVPGTLRSAPAPVSTQPSSENKIPHNHVVIYAPSPSDEDAPAFQTLRPGYLSEPKIKENDSTNGETINNAIFQSI